MSNVNTSKDYNDILYVPEWTVQKLIDGNYITNSICFRFENIHLGQYVYVVRLYFNWAKDTQSAYFPPTPAFYQTYYSDYFKMAIKELTIEDNYDDDAYGVAIANLSITITDPYGNIEYIMNLSGETYQNSSPVFANCIIEKYNKDDVNKVMTPYRELTIDLEQALNIDEEGNITLNYYPKTYALKATTIIDTDSNNSQYFKDKLSLIAMSCSAITTRVNVGEGGYNTGMTSNPSIIYKLGWVPDNDIYTDKKSDWFRWDYNYLQLMSFAGILVNALLYCKTFWANKETQILPRQIFVDFATNQDFIKEYIRKIKIYSSNNFRIANCYLNNYKGRDTAYDMQNPFLQPIALNHQSQTDYFMLNYQKVLGHSHQGSGNAPTVYTIPLHNRYTVEDMLIDVGAFISNIISYDGTVPNSRKWTTIGNYLDLFKEIANNIGVSIIFDNNDSVRLQKFNTDKHYKNWWGYYIIKQDDIFSLSTNWHTPILSVDFKRAGEIDYGIIQNAFTKTIYNKNFRAIEESPNYTINYYRKNVFFMNMVPHKYLFDLSYTARGTYWNNEVYTAMTYFTKEYDAIFNYLDRPYVAGTSFNQISYIQDNMGIMLGLPYKSDVNVTLNGIEYDMDKFYIIGSDVYKCKTLKRDFTKYKTDLTLFWAGKAQEYNAGITIINNIDSTCTKPNYEGYLNITAITYGSEYRFCGYDGLIGELDSSGSPINVRQWGNCTDWYDIKYINNGTNSFYMMVGECRAMAWTKNGDWAWVNGLPDNEIGVPDTATYYKIKQFGTKVYVCGTNGRVYIYNLATQTWKRITYYYDDLHSYTATPYLTRITDIEVTTDDNIVIMGESITVKDGITAYKDTFLIKHPLNLYGNDNNPVLINRNQNNPLYLKRIGLTPPVGTPNFNARNITKGYYAGHYIAYGSDFYITTIDNWNTVQVIERSSGDTILFPKITAIGAWREGFHAAYCCSNNDIVNILDTTDAGFIIETATQFTNDKIKLTEVNAIMTANENKFIIAGRSTFAENNEPFINNLPTVGNTSDTESIIGVYTKPLIP